MSSPLELSSNREMVNNLLECAESDNSPPVQTAVENVIEQPGDVNTGVLLSGVRKLECSDLE